MTDRGLKYRKGSNTPPVNDRLVLRINRGMWMDDASCRDADIGLFYDTDHEIAEARLKRVDAAKEICSTCPVQAQCLDTALANDEAYGIWGGFTASERYRIAQLRRNFSA